MPILVRCLLFTATVSTVFACGPHLRTCDVGCGEGAYCDEPSQLCILLLADGGRWVDPSDAGPPIDAPRCRRGDTRPCAPGCGAVEKCTAAGEWGTCGAPDCGAGSACVNDRCVCNAQTCAGCCLNESVCRPGTEDFACGAPGEACKVCGIYGCQVYDGHPGC